MLLDLNGADPAWLALGVLQAVVVAGLLGLLVVAPRWRARQRTRPPRSGDIWSLRDGRMATVLSPAGAFVVVDMAEPTAPVRPARFRRSSYTLGEWVALLQRTDAHLVRRGPRRRAGT